MTYYKRSAFLNLLQTKYTCELKPLGEDGRTILVRNGPASAYIYIDELDRIDYEEILICYRKLCLESMPQPSDLLPADDITPAVAKKKKEKSKPRFSPRIDNRKKG